ncbi:MAG: SIMPL domain-containing protein [Thermodesulfobacteriota bacterium]
MKRTKNCILFALLFFLITTNAAFPQFTGTEKNTLQVNGKGQVTAIPDVANITITVETTKKTASEAVKDNAERMNMVMSEIKSKIGKDDKLSTSGYSLSPIYSYDDKIGRSILTGYTVSNSILIRIKNLKEVGNLIDSATQVGANRIDSLSFDTDKRDEYRKQALVKAVQDARETAEIVSNAAGVSIVKIIQISPSYDTPIPIYKDFAVAREAAAPPPTQIEPGELVITATVNIVFEIK